MIYLKRCLNILIKLAITMYAEEPHFIFLSCAVQSIYDLCYSGSTLSSKTAHRLIFSLVSPIRGGGRRGCPGNPVKTLVVFHGKKGCAAHRGVGAVTAKALCVCVVSMPRSPFVFYSAETDIVLQGGNCAERKCSERGASGFQAESGDVLINGEGRRGDVAVTAHDCLAGVYDLFTHIYKIVLTYLHIYIK